MIFLFHHLTSPPSAYSIISFNQSINQFHHTPSFSFTRASISSPNSFSNFHHSIFWVKGDIKILDDKEFIILIYLSYHEQKCLFYCIRTCGINFHFYNLTELPYHIILEFLKPPNTIENSDNLFCSNIYNNCKVYIVPSILKSSLYIIEELWYWKRQFIQK